MPNLWAADPLNSAGLFVCAHVSQKYILVNDIHLSDRAPASCTDTYLDDLFALLYQVSGIAKAIAAIAIVLAGDVFHHKVPGRTGHSTVMRLIEWAQSSGEVLAVVGNHDIQHDRLDSIDEGQPLGVVFKSGAIERLEGWWYQVDPEDTWRHPIYGVPWLMNFDDVSVGNALAEFHQHTSEHVLVVTHAPLYPPGRELKYEFYPAVKWAAAMGNQGTVHYGHVHSPHGIYEVDGVAFSNCGALSRGSLDEHNLNRMPSIAIWDSGTGQMQHVALDAKPPSEVFRLVEAQAKKDSSVNLSSFLESVQKTRLDITSTDSVLQHVRETQQDPALVSVIAKLLEEVNP